MSQILLFDLDGTLIDSRLDLALSVNMTRADYGLPPLSLEEIVSYIGDGVRKLIVRAFADYAGEYDVESVIECNQRHYHAHLLDHTSLYPGVTETLAALHERYSFGVISNKPDAACHSILEGLGVLPYFSSIVGGGRTVHLKPSPEPLLLALSESGCQASGSWMIGDHRTDLGAAQAAGMHGCFCTYGYGRRDGLPADAVIDRFSQLAEILL